MSFGYSVGDFIAGANLSYQLIQALSGSRGASIEYQEAIAEIATLQETFLTVSQMRANSTLSQATINMAQLIVMSSMELIGTFLSRTQKYREKLCGRRSGGNVSDSWQKVGWMLFKKEELRQLRGELHLKLSHISLLLATAQVHGKIPTSVAQYEVDSFDGPSPAPLAQSGKPGASTKRSQLESPPDEKAVGAMIQEKKFEEGMNYSRASSGDNTTKGSEEGDPELEKRLQAIEELMRAQKLDFERAQKEIAARDAAAATRKAAEYAAKQKADAARKAAEEKAAWEERIKNERRTAEEKDAEKAARAAAKAAVLKAEADAKAVVENAIRESKEAVLKAKEEANEAVAKAQKDAELLIEQALTARKEKKKPLKFKDAVGRRFSFPFDLCATWAGMEELIKQAFLHVDVIGPHVMNGAYDIVLDDGGIILPQAWETTIEPDWSVTMIMWPLPELMDQRTQPTPSGWAPGQMTDPPGLTNYAYKVQKDGKTILSASVSPPLHTHRQLREPSIANADKERPVSMTERRVPKAHSKGVLNWMQSDDFGSSKTSSKPELLPQCPEMSKASAQISRDSFDSESTSRLSQSQSATSTLVELEADESDKAETQKDKNKFEGHLEKLENESESAGNARRPHHRRPRRRRPKAL